MESKIVTINYSPVNISKKTQEMIEKVDEKRKIIQTRRPFEGRMLKQVSSFYKIDTVWASEAIEGNTLTLGETKVLLEDGITVGGKPFKDSLKTAGHGEAYDYMFSLLQNDTLSIQQIFKMHKLLLGKEDSEIAGRYKIKENMITGSMYSTIPIRKLEEEMKKFEEWMHKYEHSMHPVLYAAELHRMLVYIHPFQDGNGRTARLAMNAKLIQNGYLPCPVSPAVKLEYNEALEIGRAGERDAFIYVIAEIEHETQKDFGRYMDIDFKAELEQLHLFENTIQHEMDEDCMEEEYDLEN